MFAQVQYSCAWSLACGGVQTSFSSVDTRARERANVLISLKRVYASARVRMRVSVNAYAGVHEDARVGMGMCACTLRLR